MKKSEIRQGMTVADRWFPDFGNGIVYQILKTRIKVKFSSGSIVTYDIPHLKFLEKVKY